MTRVLTALPLLCCLSGYVAPALAESAPATENGSPPASSAPPAVESAPATEPAPPADASAATAEPHSSESPAPAEPAPAATDAPAAAQPAATSTEPPSTEPPPLHDPKQPRLAPAGTPSRSGPAHLKEMQDYRKPTAKHLVEEEKEPSNFMIVPQVETTFAFGEAAQFAGGFGLMGFGLEVRYLGFRPWRIGVSAAWQTLSQRKEDTVTSGDVTYTGTMVKELSYNPLLLKIGRTLSAGKKATTFAAIGLGGTRGQRRTDTGIISLFQEQWHFAIAAEAGVEVPVSTIQLVFTGRLNYLFPAGAVAEQTYFNLCAGVGFN